MKNKKGTDMHFFSSFRFGSSRKINGGVKSLFVRRGGTCTLSGNEADPLRWNRSSAHWKKVATNRLAGRKTSVGVAIVPAFPL